MVGLVDRVDPEVPVVPLEGLMVLVDQKVLVAILVVRVAHSILLMDY